MCINIIIFYYKKQVFLLFDILDKSQKYTILFIVRFPVILSFKMMNYNLISQLKSNFMVT